MRRIDLTGQRFSRLLVLQKAASRRKGKQTRGYWLCLCDCGQQKEIEAANLRKGASRSCGCLAREEASARQGKFLRQTKEQHWNWQGGAYLSTQGYVRLSIPGLPFEHCVVMERILGRALTAKETVHHKNGIRNDNRPENLELWASNHPSGQRVEDLVAWAKEILARYESPIVSPCCV